MHYYKRNLGDYAKKAGRLSMLQHGAYNLLIDACYDREDFPNFDEAVDWAWASTDEEIKAVEFVLSRFFELGEDGKYRQGRIADELLDYNEFCRQQTEKGKRGGRPKKPNGLNKKPNGLEKEPTGNPSVTQPKPKKSLTTNHYPLTTNQEPLTNKHTTAIAAVPAPPPVCELFDLFYEAYPKKVGKGDALKAWGKLNPDQALTNRLIHDVRERVRLGAWCTGKDKGYIPGPAPYLNQRRWEDEIIPRPEFKASVDYSQIAREAQEL